MKILKWSVIPTLHLQRLKRSHRDCKNLLARLSDGLHDGYTAVYDNVRKEWRVLMYKCGVGHIVIKVFPYGDDPAYARLCAEELLDKLNERM